MIIFILIIAYSAIMSLLFTGVIYVFLKIILQPLLEYFSVALWEVDLRFEWLTTFFHFIGGFILIPFFNLLYLYSCIFIAAFYDSMAHICYDASTQNGSWFFKILWGAIFFQIISKTLSIVGWVEINQRDEWYIALLKLTASFSPVIAYLAYLIFLLTKWETLLYGNFPSILANLCKWW